ncbi:MAG: type II/IV secretion system protein, partial [Chloroflexi bacterium]|nr:type II/IV secretion system protein [Chloroflexota bacterium]
VRLIDLGAEPFLVTSAVIGSIAQRLVRKVCTYCKTMTRVSPPEAAAYQNEMGEVRNDFYVGRGCNMCSRSGYLGRIGVYEVLSITDPIRALINRNATAGEIRAEAIRNGMISMRRDGMTKARDGITTSADVLSRVYSIV